MNPVVFLSHSSKDNARAQALDAALRAGGRLQTTFDVKDLRQGEEWRPQLYRWMARCQGAVLLITPQVMSAPYWVLQEATFLRARAMLEGPAFRLFMVIDDAVYDHTVWKSHFDPLQLDALQRFRLAHPGDPLAPVVAGVEAGMHEVSAFGSDFKGRLSELIFDRLEPFLAEQAVVREFAQGLDVADAWYQGIVGPERALQSLCARRLAGGELRHFSSLDRLFNTLRRKATLGDRERLLGVLRSHWIPLQNAARLAEALDRLHAPAPGEMPPNVVLMHTEARGGDFVAELHRERRFMPFNRLGNWIALQPGNETTAALRQQLVDALRELYFDTTLEAADLVEAVDEQRDSADYPVHTFVHLGGAVSAAHLMPVLREFWPCLFVLTAAEPGCSGLAAEIGVAAVRPHDAQLEKSFVRAVRAAQAAARDP